MSAPLKFVISQEELSDLYFHKKWSMFQIAKHYGCTHGTIVGRFKQYSLKSRGYLGLRPPICINKSQLNDLYTHKVMSVEQIASKLNCSKGGVERRLNKYKIPLRGNAHRKPLKYTKQPFNGSLEDKAYLIGFRLGDLNVNSTKQVVVVRGSTTITAQRDLIINLFNKYGGVNSVLAKRGSYEQYIFLDHSFDFLLPKHDQIEGWIASCPRCFLSFFAGYFDAEGCITLHKCKSGPFAGFEIQTYDRKILDKSWVILNKMGIMSPRILMSKQAGYIDSRGVISNGDTWRLAIFRKQSVWQLAHYLRHLLKHKNKIDKLSEVINNIRNRNIKGKGRRIINLTIPVMPLHIHLSTKRAGLTRLFLSLISI
jgi:hypothetical protein